MNLPTTFFASCPKGLEALLAEELEQLGAGAVRQTVAGVQFEGALSTAYRACLWSRLANKILLPLGSSPASDGDALYQAASEIAWEDHLGVSGSLLVNFVGTNRNIRHTQFGALRIKDAVVDRLRRIHGMRPSVDKHNPDLRIQAVLSKGHVHINLDLSGHSLHRRGYRSEQGAAPLKENLASGILLRANWPEIASAGGGLLDPMCGSGTFLVEAAWMAADIAPGLLREDFGFCRWLQHDAALWAELREEARTRRDAGLAAGLPEIRGYDESPRVLDAAQNNIERAGVDEWVRVSRKPVAEFRRPTHRALEPGLMLCNPPYGERLGEAEDLRRLYRTLGQVAKAELPGWQLGVFTGNPELGRELRLRPRRRYKLFNGPIPSELLLFDLLSDAEARLRQEDEAGEPVAMGAGPATLTQGAEMLANRLRKNRKRLGKWLQRDQVGCYRIYDADMPEYAAAIDVYEGRLHLQEYAPPPSVDPEAARVRWQDVVSATAAVFECDPLAMISKTRQRNKGKQQYEKLGEPDAEHFFPVREGQCEFLVNLRDYLDTGLFLDHRPLRRRIANEARGKRFLNLFCYTATATVHAAVGGAAETVSVDMSATYLDWARRNFARNNVHEARHQLIRADCLQWLRDCRQGFDLIMLDPPSFSNSKRMEGVLDVQRDHVDLVRRCAELLRPGGVVYFSTNLRSFRLDSENLKGLNIRDITRETLDPDFAQNPKIHQCFAITTD